MCAWTHPGCSNLSWSDRSNRPPWRLCAAAAGAKKRSACGEEEERGGEEGEMVMGMSELRGQRMNKSSRRRSEEAQRLGCEKGMSETQTERE
jgi:hypothetical protein